MRTSFIFSSPEILSADACLAGTGQFIVSDSRSPVWVKDLRLYQQN
jgi:hypothetical protein